MGGGGSVKVTLNFPPKLLKDVDRTASEQHSTRSALIRKVLQGHIADITKKRLKEQLVEGYKANAALLKQISEEFEFVDGENI